MSKSKGNVIDPLDLIDRYGTDAVRFTLIALAAQGRDIKLSASRVEGYRNFATKLWNAARYTQMNGCRPTQADALRAAKLTVNRWIVGELTLAVRAVEEALEAFRFNDAASAAYQFVWGTYCDWYLEFTKPVLAGADEEAAAETRAVTAGVLREILRLLHPFMPFITEELWDKLGMSRGRLLIVEEWPALAAMPSDDSAKGEMDWVVETISAIRTLRAEMNVPHAARLVVGCGDASAETASRLARHGETIRTLARLESIALGGEAGKGTAQLPIGGATLNVRLAGVIDVAQERARLGKELKRQADEIAKLERKLANADFLAKADPEVVGEQRERRDEAVATRTRLEAALARIDKL
jgi:valyl-tRNA synthetase